MWNEDTDLADYGDLTLPPSPLPSPPVDSVVGDWTTGLGKAGDVLQSIFKTGAQIVGARDAAANAADQRSYDRAFKASQLQLQRDALTANTKIAEFGLQSQVARAQKELQAITGGNGGGLFTILLIAGGAYLLAKKG